MLTVTANQSPMLSVRDLNIKYDTVTKSGRDLLELLFDRIDNVGFASDADLIRRLALVRARGDVRECPLSVC